VFFCIQRYIYIYRVQASCGQVRLVREFCFCRWISAIFYVVTSCTIVRMSELQVDTPYPIVYAQTVDTKYGPTVILKLQDSAAGMVKLFLPSRYASLNNMP
jgi:hypothetical protein